MTGIRLAARALFLAVVALSSGCYMLSFKDPMHREDTFNDDMKKFTQFVRWGNFSGAALYVVDEQKDEFLALAPQLTDVRFTDYEILKQELNEERDAASVDVILTGYRLSSPISRTVHIHQEWKRTGSSEWKVSIELGEMRKALGLAAQ